MFGEGEAVGVLKTLVARVLRRILERPDITIEPMGRVVYFDDYFIDETGDEELANVFVEVQVSNGGHETGIRKAELRFDQAGNNRRAATKRFNAIKSEKHSAQTFKFRFAVDGHLGGEETQCVLILTDTAAREFRCKIKAFDGRPPQGWEKYR